MRMTATAARARLMLAAGLAALAMVVLFALKLGPVVATVSHNHGIHEGDALAVPLVAAAAWLVSTVRVAAVARVRA